MPNVITDNIIKLNDEELEDKKIKNQIFSPYFSRISEIYDEDFYHTVYVYRPFLDDRRILNYFKRVRGVLWGLKYLPDGSNGCRDCICRGQDDYKRYCVDIKFTRYIYGRCDVNGNGNGKGKEFKGLISELIFHVCYGGVVMEVKNTYLPNDADDENTENNSGENNKNNKKYIKHNKRKIDGYNINTYIETWVNWDCLKSRDEREEYIGDGLNEGMGVFDGLM